MYCESHQNDGQVSRLWSALYGRSVDQIVSALVLSFSSKSIDIDVSISHKITDFFTFGIKVELMVAIITEEKGILRYLPKDFLVILSTISINYLLGTYSFVFSCNPFSNILDTSHTHSWVNHTNSTFVGIRLYTLNVLSRNKSRLHKWK